MNYPRHKIADWNESSDPKSLNTVFTKRNLLRVRYAKFWCHVGDVKRNFEHNLSCIT